MLLPFFEGLIQTSHYDPEMSILADRHYSRVTPGARQFSPNGRKLVLRNNEGTCLFVWMWCYDDIRRDKQNGYNCTIFRNESRRLSSEIILEAEEMAVAKWGRNRFFTYVDPSKIASPNPGYCFKRAGWRKVGESTNAKHLLAKEIDAGQTLSAGKSIGAAEAAHAGTAAGDPRSAH